MTAQKWSEDKRLEALRGYGILDTEYESDFDDIVKLASEICGTPISIVNLIDADRQWFKAEVGFGVRETPLDNSICAKAILQDDLFVIPDTTKDARFQNNPLVTGKPNLRFYAGALLKTPSGLPLGTLCVLDYQPRELTQSQIFALEALSRQVMSQLELRRALKEKQKVEGKVNLVFSSPEFTGFWSWNLETNLLISEPRFAEMYGVDPEWAQRGAPLEEYVKNIDPDDLARITPSIERTITEGADYDEEYRLIQKDGSVRWVAARGNAHLNAAGKPVRFDGVAIDITDRKKAELRLRDRDLSLRTALQAGRMGTWELDIATVRLTCSKTCNANYGLPPEAELTYQRLASLVHPGDIATWNIVIENAISTASDFEMEYRVVWPDESIHWIYVRGDCTARSGDKASKLAGVSIDITARKRLEEVAIEAQQAAEAANMAKSEFLANMSHEIRTPMNAVIGLSTILAMSQGLTPRQKEYVSTLQLSADALLSLINDLLDISKIEARSIELEHIPFSLTQMLNEVISMMSMRAQEKGLEFKATGESNIDYMLIGDPNRLRQIILNLCSNAIKFTEAGGVYISFARSKSDTSGVENISITVQDTGIGIAPEKQEAIFHKFIQADSSINRKYGGTGLGLAITKTLTEIMGGTIELASQPGKGSAFTVTVPLMVGNNADVQPITKQVIHDEIIRPISEHRILLVEDYAANVLVAGTYLEEFGYDYDVADNGHQGLEKAKSGQYLAILMDVQMPGLNGFEATRLIREHENRAGKKRTPILGMTAHALSGDRERCLAADMDDYLSKPYDREELRKKLASYIGPNQKTAA